MTKVKYLVIPHTEEESEITFDDLSIVKLSAEELADYMEATWDRGVTPPTLIEVEEIEKALKKLPVLTLDQALGEE